MKWVKVEIEIEALRDYLISKVSGEKPYEFMLFLSRKGIEWRSNADEEKARQIIRDLNDRDLIYLTTLTDLKFITGA